MNIYGITSTFCSQYEKKNTTIFSYNVSVSELFGLVLVIIFTLHLLEVSKNY